ncbi:DegT/DnrJ/EryC1/StrS family aminotransferase [Alicyclobacillus sp. ALC3]|uniref:DegT/DnrJ/EryC1/StrS family aminotransferase n=1 Tax=Alicyclobacillus sp. ALC3 TaxID=2796143 RepID=UPI00237806FE|nr:DegT/DnrJ/EryC1/StrS family aminotransferase [Alicyclobacillus sp. ALC3]WDL95152.1 DegT/DnrJ/EryC1/StrS family aminotransferase [Alicyclobacillus sp. ALC3]
MFNSYPVSAPTLNGNERKYVMDCVDSTWISSKGGYIDRFEEELATFCHAKHAIVCSSGTTALHLALMAYDVQPGDEVMVPTLTFVATANAVTYCGAVPVFVDVDPVTWNMDAALVEAKITPRTKGIIPVHLYGHPADMDPILTIARRHGLFVVEDAAEAIGAQYRGQSVGSIGNAAIFSFFGNKIITTGEGGAVTTNDDTIAAKVRLLRDQGMDRAKRYWYPTIGYNYRMTNVQAAIGCAQLERISWHIEQRTRVAKLYTEFLNECQDVMLPREREWAKSVSWMFSIVLQFGSEVSRDSMQNRLAEVGIETRPFFYPMHRLPPYAHLHENSEFPVANRISTRGLNLPTYAALRREDIDYISGQVKDVVSELSQSE